MSNGALSLQPPWLDARCPREGRYVLGPLLGKGGMGEVVEAWDVVLCRTVALKVLRNMEPTALIRFMHEAQIQARVAHPHICRIYDVDSGEGTVKIAMQLIRGPNLEQACRDLSVLANVTLMAEVAEAVHAAHALKLIHRDLKPSNILLEKGPNGRWLPYICDFGLAMSLDEPALTATGGALGTPAFMAPEQLHGPRSLIGPATDVYGLGGTLHYALLGRPPEGPTRVSRPQSPLPVGKPEPEADLPGELKLIVRKCLEEDPALRYPSAAALAEDLWRFVKGEPIHAAPAGPLRLFWRRRKRHLKLSLGSALFLGSLLAGWALEGLHLAQAQAARLAVARGFSLEAADLDRAIRLERMLPAHDLRPAWQWFRSRLEVLRARAEAQGEPALVPGRLALARAELLLEPAARAREDAEWAWRHDGGNPEAALLLALATGRAALELDPPAQREAAARMEPLLKAGLPAGPEDYPRALVAFLRQDYATAAAVAGSAARTRPWDADPAILEVLSHCAMAGQRHRSADLAGAEDESRQAVALGERFLEAGRSDAQAAHACFMAARWQLSIQQDRGRFDAARGAALLARCGQALRLDPDDPDLQEDWLGLSFLCAQAAPRLLQDALVFLGSRLKEPLTPGLAQARMLVLGAAAQREREPGPALAEALRVPAAAPFLRREELGRLLDAKARAEAAQGLDPGPTLDQALAFLQARLQQGPDWCAQEALAEAWLIRGTWELDHGLAQAGASLRQAEACSDQAVRANPGSAYAQGLSGLVRLREIKAAPGQALLLRPVALARLRAARALHPDPLRQAWLQRSLRDAGGGP